MSTGTAPAEAAPPGRGRGLTRLGSGLRARLTLGRIILAAVLIGAVFAGVALWKGEGGGAPPDRAARLVPANAVLYLHVTIDRDSNQWKNAGALFPKSPLLLRLRDRLLRQLAPGGKGLNFDRDVFPWLGKEASIALLPSGKRTARSLILLQVADRELAQSFLSRAKGQVHTSEYRGVTIHTYGKLSTAFMGDFLAVGRPENVYRSIDAHWGLSPSLTTVSSFRLARRNLPERQRLLYAYASQEGVRGILRHRPGLLGWLAALTDDPRLGGAVLGVTARQDGIHLDFASALNGPAGRSAPRGLEGSFRPALPGMVPAGAVAYLDMRGADRLLGKVTSLAGGTAVRLPAGLDALRADFEGAGGAPIRRELRPLLTKEAALFATPGALSPVLTMLVNDVHPKEADELLTRLQPLLSRVLEQPAAGQVPFFRPQRIGGVDAATLRISPVLQLTYSIFGGRLAVSTDPGGIRQIRASREKITRNPLFAPEIQRAFSRVTALLFLDLDQLFALGEKAGLESSTGYRRLKSALTGMRALSAVTSSSPTSNKAAIFIEVQ